MREGGEWPRVALGSVTSQVKDLVKVEKGVEYRLLGVSGGGRGVFGKEPVTTDNSKAKSFYRVKAGQFIYNRLFAGTGSFGVIPYGLDGAFVSNEFPVFEADPSLLDVGYLYLVFQQPTVWAEVASECIGTTGSRMRWNESRFAGYRISLPPLGEQRRIVDLIAAVDENIAAADTLAESAQAARSSLLSELLGAGGEDWVETTLGEVGSWKSGSTPKATNREFYGGEIPFVAIGDLNGGVITETERTLSLEGLAEIGKSAPAGSVFLSMYGSIGKVGIAGREMATNQAIAWLECCPEVCTPEFMVAWLASRSSDFDSQGRGATQRNINREIIRATPVLLPPLVEQQRIVDLIAGFDESIVAAQGLASASREVRSALLADLLSGDHEIPESYDALLEAS